MSVRPFLFFFALSAAAQDTGYFPLQTGNQWVYRQTRGLPQAEARVLEVGPARLVNGIEWFPVSGFPERGPMLVRNNGGILTILDSASGAEVPWVDFNAALDEPFSTGFDSCSPSAAITARDAALKVPIGDFTNALTLTYRRRCADAGLIEDVFLPGIGLARRSSDNIAGAQTFELVYARIAGFTVYTEPEHSFQLTFDSFTYPRGALITARIGFRNTAPSPIALVFRGSQDYDIIIRNSRGELVWRWSDGKAFTLNLRPVNFTGERNWVEAIRIDLPEGTYTATASLAVLDRKYESTIPFAIVSAR